MVTNHNDNIIISNYDTGDINNTKTKLKIYKYCEKCTRELPEGSVEPFCCWECRSEFFAENRRENDALYREWASID